MGSRLNPLKGAREFDEFLLDRVFQPIVDRCGHPISIASFLIDGLMALWGYRTASAVMDGEILIAALSSILLPVYTLVRFIVLPLIRSRLRTGLRNPLRFRWQPIRLLAVYLLIYNSLAAVLVIRGPDLDLVSDVLWLMAAYIAACDVLPPKPKPVRLDTARVVGIT
jgi:hypothetical protein